MELGQERRRLSTGVVAAELFSFLSHNGVLLAFSCTFHRDLSSLEG
jgi:hypothetical protein